MADKNSSSKIMYLSIALAVILMAVVVPFSMSGKGKSDAVSSADDVESRIAPVAKIEMQAGGGDGGVKDGKTVYNTVCAGCHGAGVLGAPKFGDKAAWAPRLKDGIENAIAIGIKGLNAMPPKGGYTGSDEEFKAAALYMINNSK